MRRRVAIPLAVLWLAALVVFDVQYLVDKKVAHAHLSRALAEMFEAPVSFGDLSVSPAGAIVVSDIRVMRPDRREKVYGTIDEVRITPRWIDLLTRADLVVKDIAVRNPTLVVQWDEADGTFDMPSPLRSDLERRTREIGELPVVGLQGLTLVLENPPDIVKKQQSFDFEQLSITLTPEGSARWLYRFEADVQHPVLGRLKGTGRFSREAFVVEMQRQGLVIGPALLAVVRPEIRQLLEKLVVDGDVNVTAAVAPVEGGSGEVFSASLDCRGLNARLEDWPQALSGIQGRLDYSRGRLTTEGLTARFEGAPLHLTGFVDFGEGRNAVVLDGSIIGLRITNQLAARTRLLPEPCPTIADQIEAWDPDAFATVAFRLEQDRDASGDLGPIRPAIDVEFNGGASIRYVGHVGEDGERHGFAYPLEDVRGVLRFTDKELNFERLTAMNGSMAVEARGRINYEVGGGETYDVDVDAHGLKLDDRVSAALTGGSRELFNSLDAQGTVDLVVGIKRKSDEPPGPRVDVAVEMQGVAVRPRQFPLDFTDARGRVMIPDSGPIRIERVSARRAGGSLAVQGAVPAQAGVGALDLAIEFDKFPVDSALTAALRELVPDAAGVLAALNPSGRVDGSLHVVTEEAGPLSGLGGSIAFEDMTLAPEDPSLRIEDFDGSVAIGPSTITINRGTTAAIAGERFAVVGTIQQGGAYDLSVEAENFQIDSEFIAEIEPLIPWIRSLGPKPSAEGPMSARVHVTGASTAPEVSAELEFLGVAVSTGSDSRPTVRDLKGRFTIARDGKATIQNLSARIPLPGPRDASPGAPGDPSDGAGAAGPQEASIGLQVGSGSWTPREPVAGQPSAGGRLDLAALAIRGAMISPSLIALLPLTPEVRRRLDELALAGTIDLSLGKLRVEDGKISASKSRLAVTGLSVGAERSVRADSFVVDRMTVSAGGGGFDLGGAFTILGARVKELPLPAMVGAVRADLEGVRFENIEADLFAYETRDDRRFALGKINPETSFVGVRFEGGDFDSNLRFSDVNLPAAIRVFGGDPGRVSGTFSSRVALRGTLGEPATYEGSGNLAVRARNVVSLPVFYRMFNSLDVLKVFEKTDPWTRVEVDFAAANRVLNLGRIRIDAPDILLRGAGTLSFDGIVRADLKADQGIGISPIGWVTRLISHVMFAGVRLEGPIGDPRVSAYPIGGG